MQQTFIKQSVALAVVSELAVLPWQGTQSANPHNDYCQHFVDTGQRPQNFIRDVGKYFMFEY
jgi:hypothetical protein